MANKYFSTINNTVTDIATIKGEPQLYDPAPGFGTATDSLFKGEAAYQKPGTYETTLTIPNYLIGATPVTVTKRGYFPTPSNGPFWTAKSCEVFTVTRTDTSLTISGSVSASTVTYGKDDFRSGVIPHELLVLIVAGGGGGGGCGYYENEDKDMVKVAGGAGGGGGVSIVRVNIDEPICIQVGGPGMGGTNGSSSKISSGTNGGSGSNSSIRYKTEKGAIIIQVIGGSGGEGSKGGDKTFTVGKGGSGGAKGTLNTQIAAAIAGAGANGGSGNYSGSTNNTSRAKISFDFAPGSGAPKYESAAVSRNGSTYNYEKGNGVFAGSFYAGGCSYGYGDYPTSAGGEFAKNGGGGHGGSMGGAQGAMGYAALWY
jgi:hypothetical protein